ncbi:MAG: effector protein PipB [Gammaproteobacteria bacterium]|nr:effector protein PipB [Gammaproteobacteria bacterium]
MGEPLIFTSSESIVAIVKSLVKILKSKHDERKDELTRINDIFGNCEALARYYIEPNGQNVNPADELEDGSILSVRSGIFRTINDFLNRDIVVRDGASQMIVLADAGMGKTSLLMMLKLGHLTSFWPKNYHCELLKLDQDTLRRIQQIQNKTNTVLLLDSLDEDPSCRDGMMSERLEAILSSTVVFHRVIITCRTQFFPDVNESNANKLGKINFSGYSCPLTYISLFDEQQVKLYLKKRFPGSLIHKMGLKENLKFETARTVVEQIGSLQFRPFLLAHIQDIVASYQQGSTEYDLYEGLVQCWIRREVRRLREKKQINVKESDLLTACVWIAESIHKNGRHTIKPSELFNLFKSQSTVIALREKPENLVLSLEGIDIGTDSLLNRNSNGDFRFSHTSLKEFLLVYGANKALIKDGSRLLSTDKIVKFLHCRISNRPFFGFYNDRGGILLVKTRIGKEHIIRGNFENAEIIGVTFEKDALQALKGKSYRGAKFVDTGLGEANMAGSNLSESMLENINLRLANMENCLIENASFKGANLSSANLKGAILRNSNFENANLDNAQLAQADLSGASLCYASLCNANLRESEMKMALLVGANLASANLRRCNLFGASLVRANLISASLKNANLNQANLEGAKTTNSDLSDANT